MPWHYHVPVSEFSPKAWSAMGQLLGGVDRISEKPGFRGWSDGFIVNLGREGYSGDQELDLRCERENFFEFVLQFTQRTIS